MSIKLLQTSALATVIGLASINTQAASIWLQPLSPPDSPQVINVNIGEVATLEMWADASDVGGFLAGGLDLFYDSTLLTYNDDFAFDPSFPTDPDFSRPGTSGDPDNCFLDPSVTGCSGPGEINGIAFGNFNGLAADGPTLVGTLSFGGTPGVLGIDILTMADNDFPAGNWFATDGTDLAGLVEYGDATIEAVPLPAAAWLMFGGLGMLLSFTRKRK
jgi:hypothetical protein